MRFIASADWQLGKQAIFLPEEARARYAQARLDAVVKIARLAAERSVDFVVVCGDVFESNQLDRQILLRTFEALRQYPVPVYLLPGNHDPLDASSIYRSGDWLRECPPHVHVLDKSGSVPLPKTRDGQEVELIAAPWFSKDPRKDLTRAAIEQAMLPDGAKGSEAARIVVGHGAISTLSPDSADFNIIDAEFLSDCLDAGHVDFVVLGDRHGTYQVAPRIWYSGTPEVTAEREIDPGNVLVIELEKSGDYRVDVESVGTWKFSVIHFDLNTDADLDALAETLQECADKENTSIKLALTGTLTVWQRARLEEIIDRFSALYARLTIWESHTDLAVVAHDEDLKSLNLSGYALEAAQELQASAGREEQGVVTEALGLLFRLAKGQA